MSVDFSSGRVEGINYLDNQPVAVWFDGGIITKIERIEKLNKSSEILYLAPGFIDIQVNGYDGVSFSLEGADDSSLEAKHLSVEEIRKITKELWAQGVTSYFPTLTTNSQELFLRNISILKEAMNDPENMGSIPGLHFEGPYISAVDGYRGAHPKEHVRIPDWNEFMQLYDSADGKILIVTMAPETEGATDFIRKCREKGIVVSLGHHNGSADQIHEAAEAGAQLSTHLGNGCATTINRHRNPLWPQLTDDRLMASIISDSFHLPPDVLKAFYKIKGAEKTIIISDMVSYAGLPAGLYKIKTGETIEKAPNGHLRFSGQEAGLYGSATPLPEAVSHMMHVTGCSLGDIFKMTAANPAKLHNLNDRGAIEPGKRADFIMFSMNDSKLQIERTFVCGNEVYTR
ncbi:MAG: amidohydrolase family protein [Bacteroidetes bacterium]|nr:amidohydrolase family protein [Bacteroidota bacterium]